MKKTMKSLLLMGCAAGLALSLQVSAHAQVPIAILRVNGETQDISSFFTLDPQSGLFVIPTQPFDIGGTTITLGAFGKPDPSLVYNLATFNPFTVAIPFSVDLSIPITPTPAGALVTSSLGVTITDGPGSPAGSAFAPFPTTPYLSGFAQTFTGDAIDVGSGVDIGTAFNGPAGGTTTMNFAGSGVSPFGFSNLDVHLSFTLSPGDLIGITAREDVTVPEPGTVALLVGLGVSSSAFALRRKRQAKQIV